MSKPWMKFYPSDWRSDPALRMCSLSARGLWVELLAIMHEAEPYGHLLIAGIAPSDEQLVSQIGADIKTVRAAMVELRNAKVFSLADSGVMYSRRMVRDAAKAEKDKQNGKTGGNPRLNGTSRELN